MSNEVKMKSFWEKPEGFTGKIGLGLLTLGGGYLAWIGLPILIVLLSNTLYAIFLMMSLGAVTFLALDSKVRNLIGYGYKGMMRGVTRVFIELDPIAIIDTYISDLKGNSLEMNKQISNLKGQMLRLDSSIKENEKELGNNLKLATKAKEIGKSDVMILKSRQAGRLKDSNMTLQALYSKMEMLYRVLVKMQESSEILIEDIQEEVKIKKRERDAIRAGHSALTSAMKIIKGDPDKVFMFEQAMEIMADDVGAKVGEMQRFMEISSGFMESVDLQKGVYEEEGLKLLEDWEKNGTALLLGGDKEKEFLIAASKDDRQILDLGKAPVKSKYSDLME